jgi:beta-glucosidase-like glycosyl hydrolase
MSGLCLDGGETGPPAKICDRAPANYSRFCDKRLSPAARAAALVAGANLTEQVANLVVGMPGFPRLGVGPPDFGEALHGVCKSCVAPPAGSNSTGCATSFPHALALAATFNSSRWAMVGDVIGLEGRALQTEGKGGGIAYFAPNVNLYRDSRWGRGMEVRAGEGGRDITPFYASPHSLLFGESL